jgi:hypothetical protein
MQYDEIQAGPELDALIAEKVFRSEWDEKRCRICGWPLKEDLKDGCVPDNCALRPAPARRADAPAPYSTDLEAAWHIVDKLNLCVHRAGSTQPFYWVGHPGDGHTGMVGDVDNPTVGTASSAPLAICRSALKIMALILET